MRLHVDVNRNRKQGYKHSNVQKGWADSSPNVGYSRDQLQDEDYDRTLAIYSPLWRSIVTRHKKEASTPLVVLGYNSIPFAIELSQWDYPVTYITDTWEGVKKAQRDCEIQAGFFYKFLYFNFLKNCPQTRIILFTGILEHLSDELVEEFLDMILRRCRKVICAVPLERDWRKLLDGKYEYSMTKYNKEGYFMLCLEA